MENVWVVTSNSWNGEHDVINVIAVMDEETAKAFVASRNEAAKKYSSPYATTYECEEFVYNETNGY